MQRVDVIEALGERVPLDLHFTDSDGKPFTLAEKLHQARPVVLTLVYYRCPMLCPLVLGGMIKSLTQTHLALGKDYDILTVSIDPNETSAMAHERKRGYLQALGRGEADPHWTFATGDGDSIHALAKAVGYEYTYDAQAKQFAHNAVLMLLSPDGKIARYLYGVEFTPRDLELSLVEASNGKVGTSVDRLLLTCYQYDAAKRRYGPYIFAFIRIGALLVFFALAGLLTLLWRQELKARKHRGVAA